MSVVLICNIDILFKQFNNWNNEYVESFRDDMLIKLNSLVEDKNKIVFISRDDNKICAAKNFCESRGYNCFDFISRKNVNELISSKKSDNHFVVVGTKDIDFQMAVNSKLLLVVPAWIPIEGKADTYGLHVDNPIQFNQLIMVIVNNHGWYSYVQIDPISSCISLYDARTKIAGVSHAEKSMLNNFQMLLKNGESRNYYQIMLYYFLSNMTRDTTFDDITIYGIMPSSSGMISRELFEFSDRVRIIKKLRYPTGLKDLKPEEKNILIRHTKKTQQHSGNQSGRSLIGGTQEFETIMINPAYEKTIKKLKEESRFNVCIFDDYMNFGNGFNAVRCLFEYLDADKIVFVSMGMFRKEFYRKDYIIEGDVFSNNYHYSKGDEKIINTFRIYDGAKREIDLLYDIFNNHKG